MRRNIAASALTAGLVIGAPALAGAAGGRIEGVVTADGAPVPRARVVIAAVDGQARRETKTLDGGFVFDGLAPGEYRLSAGAGFSGSCFLESRPLEFRVAPDAAGRPRISDCAGTPLPAGPIEVQLEDPDPAGRDSRLSIVVRFPSGRPPDLARHPVLILAASGRRAQAAALKTVGADGRARATMLLPAERLHLQLQSARWGAAAAVPVPDKISLSGRDAEVTILAQPAGSIAGRLLGPDRRPLRLDEGSVMVSPRPDAVELGRAADRDGSFDLFGLPARTYRLELVPRKELPWAYGASAGVRVEADETARADLALEEGVAVELEGAAARPSPGGTLWVRALPASTPLDADAAWRLFHRARNGSFQFLQDERGSWGPWWGSGRVLAPPGRYDLYLVEMRGKNGRPFSLHILSRLPGFAVRRGAPAKAALPPPAGAGPFSLSGEIVGLPTPSDERVDAYARDPETFFPDQPLAVLRSATGERTAFGWALPGNYFKSGDLGAVLLDLALGSRGPLRASLGSARVWALPGLAAGDYSLELTAPGCEPLVRRLRLDASLDLGTARLHCRGDAPSPPRTAGP